jgi:hypothetical protein
VAWPRQHHSRYCRGNAHNGLPSPLPQIATASLKSPIIKLGVSEAVALKSKCTTDAVKAPRKSPLANSEESYAVILPPLPSAAIIKELTPPPSVASVSAQRQCLLGQPAAQLQALKVRPVVKLSPPQPTASGIHYRTVDFHLTSQGSPSTPTRGPSPNLRDQKQDVGPPALHSYPLAPQSQTRASYQAQDTKPQSALIKGFTPPAQDLQEKTAPVSVLTALSEARKNKPMLPDGVLVIQNEEVTICSNSYMVAQMLQYLHAENAASTSSINNGLACYIRFKRNWNGDLLLWVEPFAPGDTTAFSRGHCFLKGWVQRNLCFGVVQPSFYWKEIQNHPGFRQAAATPSAMPASESPVKYESRNSALSTAAPEGAGGSSDQKADAVLIIRGVEQRLRCQFSLNETKRSNQTGGSELELVVKRHLGTDNEGFEKATLFLRAWALHAMQSVPCKASSFLVSLEGVHILGKSLPATMTIAVSGKRGSLYSASDLDLLLSEEKAKVC